MMLDNLDLRRALVLDIETVPQYPHFGQMPEHLQILWEKKSRHFRNEGEDASDCYQRAGIYAEFGKIVCISLGVFTKTDNGPGLRIKSLAGNEERELLVQFAELLAKQAEDLILIAHNGKEFDLPYLCRRLLINGLPLPPQLCIHGKKPWEVPHLDTMELWKFGDHKNYTSLNLLAAVFDIPTSKDDIDGSEVNEVYWRENNLERIVIYCQKDVLTTARLLLKLKGTDTIEDEHVIYVSDSVSPAP